jgi:hypothetical protein
VVFCIGLIRNFWASEPEKAGFVRMRRGRYRTVRGLSTMRTNESSETLVE